MGLFVEDTGGGAPFYLEGVTVTNPNGTGLGIPSYSSPCSVRLTSCAIFYCRRNGVYANGADVSLELVDCLVLRNLVGAEWKRKQAAECGSAGPPLVSTRMRGLYSGYNSSIRVSGPGTKPAFTREQYAV